MTPAIFTDAILWWVISLPFFRALDSGFEPGDSGDIVFRAPSWFSSILKSTVVVLPILVLVFMPTLRSTPAWDAVCLAAIVTAVGPLAFPQLSVQLEQKTLFEKLGNWLLSRIDISIKKGLALLVLTFALSKVPHSFIASLFAVPHYFAPPNTQPTGPFTAAALVVAVFALVMRAMILPLRSKMLAFTLLPLSALLIGYMMDVGGSIHPPNVPLSLKIILVVVIDLLGFLVAII